MKAKQRTLLVLAALILLSAAALAAVTAANRHAEAASSEAAAGDIPLAAFAQAELTQIAYTWQGETLTLDYDGSRWTLAEDPDYHLDQTKCNTMAAAMTGLSAKRRLEPQPGEDYGLDEPSLIVSVTAAGRTETYTFGTTNPVTGDIYLQREGDSALYTADPAKAECFAYDKEGLFAPFQPAGITASSLEAIVYTCADGADRFTVSPRPCRWKGRTAPTPLSGVWSSSPIPLWTRRPYSSFCRFWAGMRPDRSPARMRRPWDWGNRRSP